MFKKLLAVAVFISVAACSAGDPMAVANRNQAESVQFTARLVQLSENPTPPGLPTEFRITAARVPGPGEEVPCSWRALDGTAGPREGHGSLRTDDQQRLVGRLTGPDRPSAETLTLTGEISGGAVRGTFFDRLYFQRAGRFEGQLSQQ